MISFRALHKISQRENISKISFRFCRNNISKISYLFKKIEKIYIWKNIFSSDEKILYFSKYLLAKIEKIFFQNNIFIFSKIEEIIYIAISWFNLEFLNVFIWSVSIPFHQRSSLINQSNSPAGFCLIRSYSPERFYFNQWNLSGKFCHTRFCNAFLE